MFTPSQGLDREMFASYHVIVTASDHGPAEVLGEGQRARTVVKTGFAELTVDVTDVNDSPPVFGSPEGYHVSVREEAPVGSIVVSASASDSDSGVNKRLLYELSDTTGQFAIDSTTGIVTVAKLLSVNTSWTTTKIHVTATDLNGEGISVSTFVAVTLITFDPPFYTQPTPFPDGGIHAEISEGAQIGTVVQSIVATARHDGKDQRITYSIEAGNVGGAFTIVASTGEISVAKALDRESVEFYDIQIVATDHGPLGKASQMMLRFVVTDTNDNSPLFINGPFVFVVRESANIGDEVGVVTANDPDKGVNGTVTLAFTAGNTAGAFKIDESTGAVLVASDINGSITDSYLLAVTATDGGSSPVRSTTTLVNVSILYFGPPAFQEGTAAVVMVPEWDDGNYIDVHRWSTSADPVDAVPSCPAAGCREMSARLYDCLNNDILGGNGTGFFAFELAGSNRVVAVAFSDSACSHRVEYADQGWELHHNLCQSSRSGGVNVMLARSQAPSYKGHDWRNNICSREVLTPPATKQVEVTKLTAEPLHDLIDRRVTYTIVSQEGERPISEEVVSVSNFNIDATGILHTNMEALDFEVFSSYSIEITATDRGEPPKTSSFKLTVVVNDVNDNPPVFSFGGPCPCVQLLTLVEELPIGPIDRTITAVDADGVAEGRVAFGFIDPSDALSDTFEIDAATGEIRLLKHLNGTKQDTYVMRVSARDEGGVIKHRASAFVLYIRVEHFPPPVFVHSAPTFSVVENAQIKLPIAVLAATPQHTAADRGISYSIVSGNIGGAFRIRATDGVLEVAADVIDREVLDKYSLLVAAEDHGPLRKTSMMEVTVNVLDANDNPPKFSAVAIDTVVREDAPIGQAFASLVATDLDVGKNAELRYAIEAGNIDRSFSIDPLTGELRAVRELKGASVDKYILTVTATDLGNKPYVSSVVVTVRVKHFPPPSFTTLATEYVLDENVLAGTVVASADAAVHHDGLDRTVDYSIIAATGIRPASRHAEWIKCAQLGGSCSCVGTVRLGSAAGPWAAQTSPGSGTLECSYETFGNPDPASSSAKVCWCSARDVNVPSDDTLFDLYATAQVPFAIDSAGNLIVKTSSAGIDYEEFRSFSISVRATDRSPKPKHSDAVISVRVLDKNDVTPVPISGLALVVAIREDISEKAAIISVAARDEDTVSSGAAHLHYSFGASDTAVPFAIDGETGRITSDGSLEGKTGVFDVAVVVSDKGPEETATAAIISITIVVTYMPDLSKSCSDTGNGDVCAQQYLASVSSAQGWLDNSGFSRDPRANVAVVRT